MRRSAKRAIAENLTLAGIEWAAVRPGVQLDIGAASLIVTSYTAPCRKIAGAFKDDEFVRVSQKVHPGWSRVYARVAQEGTVRPGDSVTVTRVP